MNDSWKKHIQPILDSWQHWDNYSWVWDPFLANYPKFNDEQRIQVEDALVGSAFDASDEDLAIKALGIAETLYTNDLATSRLSDLFRSELRKQLRILEIDHKIAQYYILAFSTFEVREAVPFIKSTIEHLEKARRENILDENNDSY